MSGRTLEISMTNFESTVDSNEIVILDFWAQWCGPCKAFAPVFEKAAESHPDICFGKIDTEKATDLAAAFQVRSIPTIMAFKKGQLVFEQAGALPPASLAKLIEALRAHEVEPGTDGGAPHSHGHGEGCC